MGAVRFEVAMGPSCQYHFKIFAQDGVLAVTSKGFQHKDSCMEAIRAVKENAGFAERYIRKAAEGKSEFILKAPNHTVVVQGGPYEKDELCAQAMAAVKASNQAAVIDKTA